MKETAVEWLKNKVNVQMSFLQVIELIQQARQMEKEQIIDAWNDGYREFYDGSSTPEEYYNQTFKSE